MNELIEFAKEQCEIFPEDSEMGKYLRETIKMLQAEHCTLDDAREDFVSDVYNILDFLPTNNEANQIIDVFDRVTSGLEQEPCEDAVSRADVIKGYIEVGRADGVEIYSEKAVPIAYINNLPSVTPARKKGKWMGEKDYPYCSECGCEPMDFIVDSEYAHIYTPMKYCPNCGIEMESKG